MFSQIIFNKKKNLCLIFNKHNIQKKWTNYDNSLCKNLKYMQKSNYVSKTKLNNNIYKNKNNLKRFLCNNTINFNENKLNNTFFFNYIYNIINTVPKFIECAILNKNEITFYVKNKNILLFLFYIKNNVNLSFKVLMDITAVDYPSRKSRFEVIYNLLSVDYNARIRIKCIIDEISPCLSVTSLYSSANWWERETYDMFGIFFKNHPDLRRILTDYGFIGHPLRKDFPLSGFVEVRYDDSEKRVITEPVEITQEFRYFDFNSPWRELDKN